MGSVGMGVVSEIHTLGYTVTLTVEAVGQQTQTLL